MNNKKLIPKLRFSEFKNSPSWNITNLGEISEIVRGASPRPIEKFITNLPDGINWIKIGDVDKNSKYITSSKEKITLEGSKKSRFVKKGSFILSNSMSFGRPYILKIDGCIHDGWLLISNFEDNIQLDFLYYLLSSEPIQNYMKYEATCGSVVTNLKSDTIKALKIPLPPTLPEQQKIAEVLSTADELIGAERRKVEALKKYKKGLMQKLFPRAGGKIPEIRFPEFQTSGEWEEKYLWQVTIWDKKFKGVDQKKQENTIKYYYYLADELKKLIREKGTVKILTTNKTNFFTNEEEVKYTLTEGEIICIPGGGNPIIQYYKGKFITSDNRIATSKDINILNNKFLYYTLINQLKLISSFYRGIGIKHPNMSQVLDMNILVPSLEEQQKIAEVLSSADELIDLENRKLEALKKYKKGLMQKLFPKIEPEPLT